MTTPPWGVETPPWPGVKQESDQEGTVVTPWAGFNQGSDQGGTVVTPWAGFKRESDSNGTVVTWLPRWGEEEVKREPRRFPDAGEETKKEEERERGNWWQRMQKTVFRKAEEVLAGREKEEAGREGKRRKRITPGNYTAMEIHGFFGLVDDGRCGQGRMLICHVPSWVKGQFMDLRDGDRVHVWNVNGRGKGVLSVLSTGRHRYYSPGSKVTTCTICVPEEEWARVVG